MFGDDDPFSILPFFAPLDGPAAPGAIARDPAAVRAAIERRLREGGPLARAALHRSVEVFEPQGRPLSDDELAAAVTRLVIGGLLVVRPAPARRAPVLPPRARARAEEPAEPAPAAEEIGVHWVEIVLVGEDGEPIPHVAYQLRDPDGRTHRGRLDERGLARVSGIRSPGECRLTFVGMDEDAWVAA